MAKVTFKGNVVETNGDLPAVGSEAPAFTMVGGGLAEKSLGDFSGKKVLTINPSYDTGVCQAAARRFNAAAEAKGVTVLAISADLPFAQGRFCEAEGLKNVVPLSSFRSTFAKDYGVELVSGPLRGLTARAVLVLDEANRVVYGELVPEITTEPNYEAALDALG